MELVQILKWVATVSRAKRNIQLVHNFKLLLLEDCTLVPKMLVSVNPFFEIGEHQAV